MALLDVSVETMSRHPGLVPLVAQWFLSEWPGWYGPGRPGDLDRDLAAFAAAEDCLPVGMVAFEKRVPVGAGALKAASIASHGHLSPWAAAGYVVPSRRGHGIGAALLDALVVKARALGFEHVYCGTSTAVTLLTRAGWLPLETASVEGRPLTVFRIAT
jgi:GNAT superfamily N-acetyltransferase